MTELYLDDAFWILLLVVFLAATELLSSHGLHVRHDEEHSRQDQKDDVEIHEGRHVERLIPLVGHGDGQAFGLFEVRNVP